MIKEHQRLKRNIWGLQRLLRKNVRRKIIDYIPNNYVI